MEHIISAYRYGSFEKIREFIEFRERLSVSLHYNSLSVDRMLLDVVFGGAASPASITHMFSFLELDPEKDDIPWREQVSLCTFFFTIRHYDHLLFRYSILQMSCRDFGYPIILPILSD